MAGILQTITQMFRRGAAAAGKSAQMASYAGGHEAAATGRRLGGWGLLSSGPTQVVTMSAASIRNRSRELERNDPLVSAGLDTLVANIIGQGITPRWILPPELAGYKDQLQLWWQEYVMQADFDGLHDFYGLQALAVRTMILSGECFGLFRYAPTGALQVQLLEPDFLDENYNNPPKIRYGIEFDAAGHPVRYHFWQSHPAETKGGNNRVAVAAGQVVHLYKVIRPGQRRGRPWLASIILPLHDLAQYNDAEIVRKKAAAMFGGFITRTEFANPYTQPDLGAKDSASGVIELEPGTFPELPPGYDVRFAEPADVGGNYDIFNKRQERRIARGFGGLTYHQLTGDLSEVNYSSIRAGNLEFQRQNKQLIYHCVVYRFCQPILQAAMDAAVLSGRLELPDYVQGRQRYYRVKWCIDGWQWVDPEKDVEAEIKAIRAGLKSRSQSISEQGRDVEDVDAENRQDALSAAGLIYDSNPAQTARNGAMQTGGE